jgi:5-methylcytosine-specific restriction endonuclease McrA
MNAKLKTDLTVDEICKGFVYNELEGKGLFGLSGKLVIQPEYQRNYLYAEQKKEEDVIRSVLKKYPLGLIYFNKVGENKYEVLDGQQRITSLGRFITGKFPLIDEIGMPHYYAALPDDQVKRIKETKLTIYICEGEETEIKEWFRTINIAGIPLNHQEISNAVYSGPFVTRAKEEFSNSQNANIQKWSAYISGNVSRQDFLRTALEWVARSTNHEAVDAYMSNHRYDDNINELKTYFTSVIDWISGVFSDVEKGMCGLEWGRLFETYRTTPYDPVLVSAKVHELCADAAVKNRKGVFEYILGGCKDTRLLDIRIFEESTKKTVYSIQTEEAKNHDVSNCPLCALGHDNNAKRIWKLNEMDADHVTAWSKGGATDFSNCQMLCKTHNRAKGNK